MYIGRFHRVIAKQETKRNKQKWNETKWNETQQKLNKIKQKRNDTRHNRASWIVSSCKFRSWGLLLCCLMPQLYFCYIMAIIFIGVGNRNTRRKPQTCCKSLTSFIMLYCTQYTSPWVGFKLTTLVVIGTDCKGCC
jgi:hypothetical protein